MYRFYTLSAKQVAQLRGCSLSTAARLVRLMRDVYHAPKVTLTHYADYNRLDVQELAKALNILRK